MLELADPDLADLPPEEQVAMAAPAAMQPSSLRCQRRPPLPMVRQPSLPPWCQSLRAEPAEPADRAGLPLAVPASVASVAKAVTRSIPTAARSMWVRLQK